MIQMILDVGGYALALPESIKDGYSIKPVNLYQDVEMISGRYTREYRGEVWLASHQYGYLSDADKERFLNACENGMGHSILCSVILPKTNELYTNKFIVLDYRPPKFMWSTDGKPLWGDYYVQIREVKPHARSN